MNYFSTALRRVLNVLMNAIVKHRDNTLRRPSVESVVEKLQVQAITVLEFVEKNVEASPQRVSEH